MLLLLSKPNWLALSTNPFLVSQFKVVYLLPISTRTVSTSQTSIDQDQDTFNYEPSKVVYIPNFYF